MQVLMEEQGMWWNDKYYQTISECADAHNVGYSTMYSRKRNGYVRDSDVEKRPKHNLKNRNKMRLDYAIQRKVMGR